MTVSRFLDGRRRVLQAWQLEDKLTSYGRTIPGDPAWAEDETDADDSDEDDSDEPEVALDPELVAAVERVAAMEAAPATPSDQAQPTAADPAGALQSACISPMPQAAPVRAGDTASLLQSACISRSPGTQSGMVSIPSGGLDAALAASILRRLATGSDPR